jgi:hypothetical protein
MNVPTNLYLEAASEYDSELARLRDANRIQAERIRELEDIVTYIKEDSAQAILNLRKTLLPLHESLKRLFGEMDRIGYGTSASAQSDGSKWDAVKPKLPPRQREAIDMLLLQGTMKRTQLANALKMDYSNCVKNVVGPLIRAGWVVDNGRDLSLKEL